MIDIKTKKERKNRTEQNRKEKKRKGKRNAISF
jgi:hypothetical protein